MQIGTFTPAKDGGWTGSIHTLTLDAKIRLVPNDDKTNDKAPAYRVLLGHSRVGDAWEAKTTGGVAHAQASGGYAFRLELSDHVLARHSRTGACSSPDDVDCRHTDLLYVYPASNGQSFQAIYLDNEGHLIHYDISTPKPGTAVFLSEVGQPGPQYRLSYELVDGALSGKFELKMPSQADFMSYLEWSGKRP